MSQPREYSKSNLSFPFKGGKSPIRNIYRSLCIDAGLGDPYLHRMKKIGYVLAGILGIILVYLDMINAPSPGREDFFNFYSNFIFQESQGWAILLVALAYLSSLLLSSMKGSNIWHKRDGLTLRQYLERDVADGLKHLLHFLQLAFPVILNLLLLSRLVGYLNMANRNRLIDPKLASIGRFLTGTYPFLSLETVKYPGWLIDGVEISFLNLPLILLLTAGITYVKSRKTFSKYVIAFLLTIVLMLPVWLAVPAMSPQDRFIDNVYHLKDPPQIENALKHFSPVPRVEAFLKLERRSKAGLEVMPTTTFPSSHAAWAAIALVYLAEASPLTAVLLSPFLLLSTFGTFYLAQHYLVDVPAGILMGLAAAAISSLLFRRLKEGPSDITVQIASKVVPAGEKAGDIEKM